MKVQNSKYQQYIKKFISFFLKVSSEILVLKKLSSQELILKVPKKKPSSLQQKGMAAIPKMYENVPKKVFQ